MDAKITILLATFNRAHLIKETLDSIIAQTYENWECIVIDDYSSDDTKTLLEDYQKKDKRFVYIKKTENYKKGLSGSRNCGLDKAFVNDAQFIQLFDDDDIMHPQKLELQIREFAKDHDLDLCVCCYRKFDFPKMIEFDLEKANDFSCKIETKDLLRSFFVNEINLNSLGPLWKASVLKDYRFNEELHYSEEREFYLRIFLNEKLKYKPINKILFWYRKHEFAITSNLYKESAIKLRSDRLFYEVFLEEVLKQKMAPAYILRFYLITSLKENNKLIFQKIKSYLFDNFRWLRSCYITPWVIIIFKKNAIKKYLQ